MTSIHGVLRHKNIGYLEELFITRTIGWNILRGRANYGLWHYIAAEGVAFGVALDKGCRRRTTLEECYDYFDRINSGEDFSGLREEYRKKFEGKRR
ncbi:hypothetical protein J4447_01380 [Candidatus Pacearchaeota archaeon]|nr:hypothetical protein [Candidatus Pacearchaeota archaeon]